MKTTALIVTMLLLAGCGEVKKEVQEAEVNYFCFFNQVYKVTKAEDTKSEIVFVDGEAKSCASDIFYEEIK